MPLVGLDMAMFQDVYQDTNPFLKTMDNEQLETVYALWEAQKLQLKPPLPPAWMKDMKKPQSKKIIKKFFT